MSPGQRSPGNLVTDAETLARAARRAMLARVQASLPRGQGLPAYVSGHEDNGGPARSGTHRHIAVVADLPRRRLLYIAPNRLQRRGVHWGDFGADHRLVERALAGLEVLRAGKAGQLMLIPASLDGEATLCLPRRGAGRA